MGARLNPPPNWPPMPEGFTPPQGWQPDPTWGAPPPGWQMWIDDGEEKPSAPSWALPIALVFAVAGAIIGMQSVTLIQGDSILYVGLALAAAGVVIAFATHVKTWAKVLAALAVVVVAVNLVSVEHQMAQQRQKIRDDLNGVNGALASPAPVAPVAPIAATPDEDTLHPPTQDVALGRCSVDQFGYPSCQLTITNHTDRPESYIVTVSAVSADLSVKYGELTASVEDLAPGQSSPQTATGVFTPPKGAHVGVSDVERFPA